MFQHFLAFLDKKFFPQTSTSDLKIFIVMLGIFVSFFVWVIATDQRQLNEPYSAELNGNFILKSSYTGGRNSKGILFVFVNGETQPSIHVSCLGKIQQFCGYQQITHLNNYRINFVFYIKDISHNNIYRYGSIVSIRDNNGDVILKNDDTHIKSSYQGQRREYYWRLFTIFGGLFLFLCILKLLRRINYV